MIANKIKMIAKQILSESLYIPLFKGKIYWDMVLQKKIKQFANDVLQYHSCPF